MLNGQRLVSLIPSATWAPLKRPHTDRAACELSSLSQEQLVLLPTDVVLPSFSETFIQSWATNLLSSVRTGQRPLTPFVYEYPTRGKTNDTTSEMIFQSSQSEIILKKPPFPKGDWYSLILTTSRVASARAFTGTRNTSEVRRYFKHNPSHLPLRSLSFSDFDSPFLPLWTQNIIYSVSMGYGLLISRNNYNWFEIIIIKCNIFEFLWRLLNILQCLLGPFSDTSKDPSRSHEVHTAWREWAYLC